MMLQLDFELVEAAKDEARRAGMFVTVRPSGFVLFRNVAPGRNVRLGQRSTAAALRALVRRCARAV
jgi:hypothetical protein